RPGRDRRCSAADRGNHRTPVRCGKAWCIANQAQRVEPPARPAMYADRDLPAAAAKHVSRVKFVQPNQSRPLEDRIWPRRALLRTWDRPSAKQMDLINDRRFFPL